MDANQIVEIIKRRKDSFFDAQIAGTPADPKEYSEAEVNWRIADEYDKLLAEIGAN